MYNIAHLSPELRERIRRNAERRAILSNTEAGWRSKSVFLSSKGYMLRPRYQAGWQPSWMRPENIDFDPSDFEDYIGLLVRPICFHLVRKILIRSAIAFIAHNNRDQQSPGNRPELAIYTTSLDAPHSSASGESTK